MDQAKGLLIESSSEKRKFSMYALPAEMKVVVTEDYQFEYRDKSIIMNFVDSSDYREYDENS